MPEDILKMAGKIRAQMKMGESIAILIIFMFLVVFGLVFYIRFSLSNLDKKAAEKADLLAIQAVQQVQTLPEFQCSVRGKVEFHCIDMLKLDAFSRLPPNDLQIYTSIFPQTYITVYQIYPTSRTWKIYGGEIPKKKTQLAFYVPVGLFNATEGDMGTVNFGYVNITVVS